MTAHVRSPRAWGARVRQYTSLIGQERAPVPSALGRSESMTGLAPSPYHTPVGVKLFMPAEQAHKGAWPSRGHVEPPRVLPL